jgi:hypothetical protein
MEPKGSSPFTQEPATCPYPDPDQSNPCPHPTSWWSILIFSSHLCLGLPSGLLPSGFPTKALYAPPKSHIPFPLLGSYRRISPIPRLLEIFHNMIHFLRWGVVSTSPNPQAGGPPFVGCPWLLIQNIRSYPPYLKAIPPSATWGRAMPWWQGLRE